MRRREFGRRRRCRRGRFYGDHWNDKLVRTTGVVTPGGDGQVLQIEEQNGDELKGWKMRLFERNRMLIVLDPLLQ